tara:strand:- start:1064723 stop:1066297 length:1575 start_codon:yes stop_codon:yes gene_type:complete
MNLMDYSKLSFVTRPGRRTFLLGTAMLGTAAAVPCSALLAGDSETSAAVLLTPKNRNDLFRVRIEMDTKGNVDVPENPLVSRKSHKKLPIEGNVLFDYEERYRRPKDADRSSEVTAVERFFHVAKQSSKLNRNEQQAGLRDSVRQTIIRRESLPETIYATEDYFRHDELDLLRIPVSSVAVDGLMPTKAVRVGDRYHPSREAMTSLLNLTSVDASDVAVEIVSFDEESAKLQFEGKIDGSVDGVPTRLRTIGKMTFDRALGTCTWLTMAIHETREIGKAEPGFDVAATIKMIRRPLDQVVALPPKPAPLSFQSPTPQDRLYVEQISREVGVSVLLDRHWRLMGDIPGSAMLRMIENDRSIAQCDLRPLATLQPGRQLTLEAFQTDVKESLGPNLSQLIEADQRLSESGLRVLRVVAQGEVQGVPIQWIMMHFSDDSGRRVVATFTMDGQSIDRFAGSDVQLASTMQFLQPNELQRGEGTKAVTRAEKAETMDSREPATGKSQADVATNSPKNEIADVQSASDLR